MQFWALFILTTKQLRIFGEGLDWIELKKLKLNEIKLKLFFFSMEPTYWVRYTGWASFILTVSLDLNCNIFTRNERINFYFQAYLFNFVWGFQKLKKILKTTFGYFLQQNSDSSKKFHFRDQSEKLSLIAH